MRKKKYKLRPTLLFAYIDDLVPTEKTMAFAPVLWTDVVEREHATPVTLKSLNRSSFLSIMSARRSLVGDVSADRPYNEPKKEGKRFDLKRSYGFKPSWPSRPPIACT